MAKRMRLGILLIQVLIFGLGDIRTGNADVAPQLACAQAGRAAEQGNALPANMLISIGLVESGRVDPLTGQAAAWPWTVNADGAGHYFQDEADAAAFARLAQSSGAQDVDIGCFQISLENHPDAFSSIDAGFDPVANANYAAQFLSRLERQAGSWELAIAAYHSSTPELGLPYQRRVLDAWRGIGNAPPTFDAMILAADPVVILEAPAARLVRVITMDGESGPPPMAGLPRVITP